ncbi:hypothetical protein Tco_0206218 [Tanacetum coccineum]
MSKVIDSVRRGVAAWPSLKPLRAMASHDLSFAALDVLTTRSACHSSLASCVSSLGESLPSVPGAYGQTLEALPSQPAASRNESHIPGVVFEREYSAAVVVPDVSGYGSRVHIHDHGGSEALDGLPDSIL